MSRVLLATLFLSSTVLGVAGHAQEKQLKPPQQPAAPTEAEPPEEDESLKPKEYTLNPLQAAIEINVGDQHMKKGKYSAATYRYLEASRWDPGNAEAEFKLGGAYEKLHDFTGAREAYGKFFELAKDDAKWTKEVDPVKKRMAKWPGASSDKTASAKK